MINLLIRYCKKRFSTSLGDYRRLHQRKAYHQILGVGPNASQRQIKANYHQLMKAHHPDLRQSSNKQDIMLNDQICRIVINAYNNLIKVNKQEIYETKKNENDGHPQEEQPQQNIHRTRRRSWKSKFATGYQAYAQPQPQPQPQQQKQQRQPRTDEEKLYYSIFGKLFQEDPYQFYDEKNAHLRREYQKLLNELRLKKKGRNKNTQQTSSNSQTPPPNTQQSLKKQSTQPQHKQSYYKLVISSVLGFGLIAAMMYLFFKSLMPKKKNHKPIRNITQQRCQQIIDMTKKRIADHYKKLMDSYKEQHPPMLKYPCDYDQGIIKQLLNYSILTDIKLYEAHPNYFYASDGYITKENLKDNFLLINHVKPNTLMTMTLEAERCLHSIYINRKDLLKELKEKGKYTPPGIFFRYYGYNYFEIRDGMPLNLGNVGNEQWISLFDLYFKYYSPLLVKKNKFYEYTTNFAATSRRQPNPGDNFLGSVHINHRKIPNVFLRSVDKNVFMWVGGKSKKQWQERYRQMWTNYYRQRRL